MVVSTVRSELLRAATVVLTSRALGMIAITRSLGDHLMKEYLSNLPHVTAVELKPEDTTLVLACDGVSNVIGVICNVPCGC